MNEHKELIATPIDESGNASFDGEGPMLVSGVFSCDGCWFHFSTPKEKGGAVYQIHFCSFEQMMKNRMSYRYIGRQDTTPDWCPVLSEIED